MATRCGAACVFAVLLAGCAAGVVDVYGVAPAAEQLTRADATGECLRRLQSMDERARAMGVTDALAVGVPGYPFLRADRFSTLWMPPAGDPGTATAGRFERMARLDAEARSVEMRNAALDSGEASALAVCRERLVAEARPIAGEAVRAARPPEAYDDRLRVLGLYWLTRWPFARGVALWQGEVRERFAVPLDDLAVRGTRWLHDPLAEGASASEGARPVAGLPPAAEATAMGVPHLTQGRAWVLLHRHAPRLAVDTVNEDDRIGALVWRAAPMRVEAATGSVPSAALADGPRGGAASSAVVGVDPERPVAYARVAWAAFDGRPALQLVYTFWFPARPPSHAFDVVAGRLDALVWRVTLDPDGEPLVYDTMHACGCYHMFFPTERVSERPPPRGREGALDETLFAPQSVRVPRPGERVTIYVGAGDHDVQRVVVGPSAGTGAIGYRLLDEDALRTLARPPAAGGGTRSVYGPDGLVPGSERPERFLFWPMGVPSAGQMRQWGHHATAFVGRRHFDDPGLVDRYFTRVAPGSAGDSGTIRP